MPHILLETSADLAENDSIPQILEDLVLVLSGFDTVDPQSVKARHMLRTNWCMGENAPGGFAHCECAVLEGRPEALRNQIGQQMFEVLRRKFSTSLEQGEVALSVEVREMTRATYFKG